MKKPKVVARPNFPNTRKDLRKQKRQQKKVHRQEHYLKKKPTVQESSKFSPGQFVRRPPDAESPVPLENNKKKKPKTQSSIENVVLKEREKEKKEVQRLNSQMNKQRRKLFLKDNEDEDKMIKKLEKQLGLNKSKNKNNYFADDGLDYLLEICDRTTSEQIVAAEKHLAEVENESDFEDDLAVVTGKQVKDKSKKKKKKSQNNSDSEESDIEDEEASSKKKRKIEEIDSEESDDANSDSESETESPKNNKNKLRKHSLSDNDISDDVDGDDEDDDDSGEETSKNEMDDSASEMEDDNENIDSEFNEESDTDTPKGKQTKIDLNAKETKSRKKENPKVESKNKELRIVSADKLSQVFSDDEVSHISGDEDLSGDELDSDNDKKKKEKPDVWEDIYGRKRDKEGNVIKEEKGIYIPPHLRNKDSTSDKDLIQLKRQIKSVLNKLAGTNLHWACTSIENLYNTNSRHGVNSALTQLWLDATVATSATPDRLVAEHAALVAVLHANVGSEIGAHFLQELSQQFDEMTRSPQPVSDKRLDNLVSCLAYLYSFKIYHTALLYDILTHLLEEISEKSIDCVLAALRSVGGVMRKDEPLALKNFIHDTQAKIAKLNEGAADGTRIKFLLEVLMAVKNNNLAKIPGYDPAYAEQLRKQTRTIVRKGNYVTTLNIRLEDLLKASERGKWWVVGSAWEGGARPAAPAAVAAPAQDQKLLDLARQQRMNTDVRRSIFCAIMASEDYMDAFEKLQRLGLKGAQQREISHVVAACCLNGRTYNPYYAVLAQKLCDSDRKYQLSFQFTIWDKIKTLEELSGSAASNLAQLLVHLFMEKGQPLSILKIIQFSDLNKKTVKFMRQILLAVIMNEDLQSSLEVFHRIAKSPKLHMFRESLRLFIQHFLVKNAGKSNVLSEEDMATLRDRVAEVDKILLLHESKLRF